MSHTQFSDHELKALLNDERNCVKLQKGIKHISLHPFYLNNVAAGIAENLNKIVSKYDKSLNGIILAYKKPRLQQSNGVIHNDKGSIFVDVEAEFYIFCPKENSCVRAIVNKTGQDHVGCLIHKAFNISVPRSPNQTDWKGKFVKTGDEILVKITYIDMFYIIPYIKGEIVEILMKSIKSEMDDDSGISTNENHPKTTKKKSKSNKNDSLTDSNKFVEDVAVKSVLKVEPEKEMSKKLRKSKNNSLIQEMNTSNSVESNTENKDDDTNISHSGKKSKKRRNTITEMTPSGNGVLDNSIISSNSTFKNKKDKSKEKTTEIDSSPIKKEKIHDKFNEYSEKVMKKKEKLMKEIDVSMLSDSLKVKKNPAINGEQTITSPKKIKSDSFNEMSKNVDAKLNGKDESKLVMDDNKLSKKIKNRRQTVSELLPPENIGKDDSKLKVGDNKFNKKIKNRRQTVSELLPAESISKDDSKLKVDDNKFSKKIKNRRQTVSELLPAENISKEEKKKGKKHNRSLDENDIAVEKSVIDSADLSPQKSKKAKKQKSTMNEVDIDIQALKNKLIQSVLKECSPQKKDKNVSLSLDQSNSKPSKKRKKKDSIESAEIIENKNKSTPQRNETLDDSENGLKKTKAKRKKINSPSEKYPSLQLSTPHYVDYVPTNEVSTFHDSISPIKMKDRPNLSSPETKKYTSPAGSERAPKSKKSKSPKRPSGFLSEFHTDLISKYLNK